MKKTFQIIALFILLGVLIYLGKDLVWTTDNWIMPIESALENTGEISAVLEEASGSQLPAQTETTIDLEKLNTLGYTWGGEYALFSTEKTKSALLANKDLVLFFSASRDPTDEELDSDIEEHISRIPENTVILKIDYDTDTVLKKSFNVAEQNTIIFLDKEWKEKTRRAVGITTLSQIVDVILDR